MWRKQSLALGVALALAVAAPAGAETKRILGIFYEGCEHLCEGFKAAIADSGFDAEVIVHDLQQDKSRLPKLVKQAREDNIDLVLTYGTSTTLGIIGTRENVDNPRYLYDIPVVFTVVADPFGTDIAESFAYSGRANVAGTFNRVPESVNVEVVRQYDPAFSKLGLLYHTNERNSVIKKEELTALAAKMGFELVALELPLGGDGRPAIGSITARMAELRDRGVKWVYLGSSSFLRKNGALFTGAAVDHGIGIVSPYESLVREQQALLSIAARYADIGKLAATQALKILRDGKTPGDLPIVRATDFAYVVNMAVAKKLNRYPPFAFMQIAEAVNN